MHICHLRLSPLPSPPSPPASLSLPPNTFLLCVSRLRSLSRSFSLSYSPLPLILHHCISLADESGGSEREYGIAEGGRPIERARGMQSERSRCCHVTEPAGARQRIDDNFSESRCPEAKVELASSPLSSASPCSFLSSSRSHIRLLIDTIARTIRQARERASLLLVRFDLFSRIPCVRRKK